ncbi:MAG TPA: hypothetical protein VFX85_02970 [Solirubrobacterales bacterium]|nr:hypothetical protein [Solirubrobacterales bacterium]
MEPFTFRSLLDEAHSIENLARRLGDVCMIQEAELKAMERTVRLKRLASMLAIHVENSEPAAWARLVGHSERIETTLGGPLVGLLNSADIHYPLDCLGVLRGLCRGILPDLYESFEDSLTLDRGSPVPFAIRPLGDGFEKTPKQDTLGSSGLLGGYGHRLFEYPKGASVQVRLDFSERVKIDELLGARDGLLPKIATIHPSGCGQLDPQTETDTEFFDVVPVAVDINEVVTLLEQVKGEAEVAVLPELCLLHPGALEGVLAAEPDAFPKLVIASSAHLRDENGEPAVRANESRIYLEGRRVGFHRKCKPFVARRLNGKELPHPMTEALTGEQKAITVLSGELSRLAVVICADVNHDSIPQKLLAAGVNTLLVPSHTPKRGGFSGPIGDLASRCQGVSVIANAPPDESVNPFHGMVAVPRPGPEGQTRTYPLPAEEDPTQIAIFDPTVPLGEAISWR